MSSDPDVGFRVEFRHIGIELSSSLVIPVLCIQSLSYTGVVALVCTRRTIAYLVPRPLALLGTTAAEEQVIVFLIVRRGAFAIKNSWRCAFETDHDSRVGFISPNMATQTISLPTEILCSIEWFANFLPVWHSWLFNVSIGCYEGHGENGLFVGNVRPRHIIHSPN